MGGLIFRIFGPFLLLLSLVPAAFAAPANSDEGLVTLDDVGTGALLLKTDRPGQYVRAPLVSSHFDIAVTGPILRGTLSQRFRNVSDQWVEGRYAFPLPDEAAVDGLKMRIGERFIEGEVQEKKQARAAYEQAKTEGKKAALVEQHRPNLFTNDVANIGPGEVVVVQITWIQSLAPVDGAFEMRLPLVVAPRYKPMARVHTVDFGPNGWAVQDPVPGRDRIDSPLIDPRTQEKGAIHNPVTIAVDLDAGFPLDLVESRHHAIKLDRPGDTAAAIELAGAVPANRDFVLRWTSAIEGSAHAALFRETVGDRDYYLAMLTPPEPDQVTINRPREVIFVQDVSGSMDGESIRQAREGLALALGRLKPKDRFNIILFNDRYQVWSPAPVAATPDTVNRALGLAGSLQAGGGTEMLPALQAALGGRQPEKGRLRQVVFLTDGAVGNEAQMLRTITESLGDTRLFTVGIGSAPNSYFMTRAAELGRGATVYVDRLDKVAEQMDRLFHKLENPVLTDVKAQLPDQADDLAPSPLPDLYAGEPVVLAFHLPAGAGGEIGIEAEGETERFGWRLPLANAAARDGVAKLWARKQIRALEAKAMSPIFWEQREQKIDPAILKIALDHQLVSRLTSLVAIDKTPSRPGDAPLGSAKVPLNLPDGWNPAVFMDRAPAQQPKVKKAALSGVQLARLAPVPQAEATAAAPPRGSLNWLATLWQGLALLLLTALAWFASRRWTGRTA